MTTTTKKKVNPRRTQTSVLRVGLLLAPFLVVFLGGRSLVSAYGDAVANLMVAMASAMDAITTWSPTPVEQPPLDPARDFEGERANGGTRSGPRRAIASSRFAETLIVPARRLLRLTARELSGIDATPAVDAAGRTAGLSLSGVQRLGLGILDGDVVTSIDGRPTFNKDAAIAAASSAWKSGARWAHALVLRRGVTIAVSVEIPVADR